MTRVEGGAVIGPRDDELAAEEPLEIRVEGRSVAVVMRTPGHDRELAAGFLLSEGSIRSAKDVFDITTCVVPGAAGEGNAVDVALASPGSFDFAKLTRHVFTSSSCGICSKASIDAVLKRHKPLQDEVRVPASLLLAL
ncbi:MAG: formate dehydrogenase accessory sulfurtransferase FdhD, partial [Verrucomicrobiota bacterium]|nr:formate dehydrogenase accessory sulfurtransferase FdhD [Verrucomicrobiota bacterium]